MTDRVPLVAVQHEHPKDPVRDVPRILARAARSVEDGGIAVLPEYFYRRPDGPPTDQALSRLDWVEDKVLEATEGIQGALVATVPELTDQGAYNTAIVAEGGTVVHRQRKVRPTAPEREAGIRASSGLATAPVQGIELGVLVCADVLALDLLVEMVQLQPEVVAVPVLSPNRSDTGDPTRASRTAVFVARAWDLGCYLVKAGGFTRPHVVGRSLITAPWGVMAKAEDQFTATLLSAPCDPARLAAVRGEFEGLGEAPDEASRS